MATFWETITRSEFRKIFFKINSKKHSCIFLKGEHMSKKCDFQYVYNGFLLKHNCVPISVSNYLLNYT